MVDPAKLVRRFLGFLTFLLWLQTLALFGAVPAVALGYPPQPSWFQVLGLAAMAVPVCLSLVVAVAWTWLISPFLHEATT